MNEDRRFNVNLDVFEGPFDLLLSLVIRQEVDICEVPIASVIGDYLSYIESAAGYDIEFTSEFLVMASTLLEIKSNILFPVIFGYDEDEEMSPEEAQKMLALRLIEYKKFKGAAAELGRRLEDESDIFYRFPLPESFLKRPSLKSGSHLPGELASALNTLLMVPPPVKIDVGHILNISVSVEDQISLILEKLAAEPVLTFSRMTSGMSSMEKAISFFAILELYRTALLELRQDKAFGPIEISLNPGGGGGRVH